MQGVHGSGLSSSNVHPNVQLGAIPVRWSPGSGVAYNGPSGYPIVKASRKDYRRPENNNFLFDLLGARDNLRIPQGISDPHRDLLGGRGVPKRGSKERASVLDVLPDLLTGRDNLRTAEPNERPIRVVNPGRNALYGTDLRPVSKILKKRVYGSFKQGNYWVTDYE